MSFCCVGNCSKKRGGGNGKSDFRCFIRWHPFPKDRTLRNKWVARIKRRASDVHPDTMYVCSDHFEDDDFEPRGLLQADILLQAGRLIELTGKQMKLKKDAIPNTERSSGLARVGPPNVEKALKAVGDFSSSNVALKDQDYASSSSTSTRKRMRRNMSLKRIDDLIQENENIMTGYQLQSSDISVSTAQSSTMDRPTLDQEQGIEPTSTPTHRDQAVQHRSSVKSQQTQVGAPCNSLNQKGTLSDLDFEDLNAFLLVHV